MNFEITLVNQDGISRVQIINNVESNLDFNEVIKEVEALEADTQKVLAEKDRVVNTYTIVNIRSY